MAITAKLLTPADFDGLEDAWDKLLADSAADTVFLRWGWMKDWWDVYRAGRELRLDAVTDGEALIGLAPLFLEKGWPRALRFCSSEDLWPDYLDVLARRGREADVARALSERLAGPADWSVLTADNLRAGGLFQTLAETHGRRETRITSRCPRVRLAGDYDAFMKEHFDRKKRYNLQRQVDIATTQQGLTYDKVEDPAALQRAFNDLFRLHALRAADKRIASSFHNPRAADFHRRFGRRALERGWLFFRLLRKDGAAVAALYGFNYNKTIFYYQSGMDPAWGKFSVGTVLLTLAVREAFSLGIDTFDFLKGDESYKKSWMTDETTQHAVRLYRNDAAGRLLYGWDRAKASLRRRRTAPAPGAGVKEQGAA